jgi:hypothetical protein
MTGTSSSRARSVWTSSLAALLGGIVVGALVIFAVKFGIPEASDFGNYFGLWVMLVTIIAAWSHSWQRAVLHAVIFLLAMVASYYVSTMLLFGYFLTRLFLAWTAVALFLAPAFSALVWHARGTGWLSALGAALPIGLLLSEAYSLRWVLQFHTAQFVFNILCAVVLLLILPRDHAQRLRVLALTPVIALGARVIFEYVWAVVRVASSY